MRTLIAAIACLFLSSPASAEWYEVQSDNFVIYADDKEQDVRRFAEMLEQYHAGMEFLTGRQANATSPSNRVTIFVAGNQRDIRKIVGTKSRSLQGIYKPRAGYSRAWVQDIRISRELDESMLLLLHEYAHHFVWSGTRTAMPRWLSEGSAEFYASARFEKDGSLSLGLPAKHRSYDLTAAVPVSVEELLDEKLYASKRRNSYDAFYGMSWLLYHYLVFNDARDGQLANYMQLIGRGMDPVQAGKDAFGDIEALQDELYSYRKQRTWDAFILKPHQLPIGKIELRRLSEGHAEILPVVMQSQYGVTEEEAAELVEDARKIAARYPDDPWVQAGLSEAEFDAGNDDAAIAAADRAIALGPQVKNAYVQKGFALFRKAGKEENAEASYNEAMKPFSALNALENDHPLPLIYYYRSYAERGVEPPENARHALERAAELAPFDHDLWLNVGTMQAKEGKIALARHSLAPLTADPHGGGRAQLARAFIDALEDAPEGEPFDLAPVAAALAIERTSAAAVDTDSE